MYCGKCGKIVADSAKFCPYCGELFNKNTEQNKTDNPGTSTEQVAAGSYQAMNAGNSKVTYQAQSTYQATGSYNAQNSYNTQNSYQSQNMYQNQYNQGYQQPGPQMQGGYGQEPPKKKKSHKGLVISLATILVLTGVGGAGGYKYLQKTHEEAYQKAIEEAKQAYADKDYEKAVSSYQSALDIKGEDETAKLGLDESTAMLKIDSATKKLAGLSSYDATVNYEMSINVEDATDGRSYNLTQSSEMTASNITGEDGNTIAYVTGDLITSADDNGNESNQSYEIYITRSGSVETSYSYTESTGWGGELSTGATGGSSVVLGDIASLSYSFDKDKENDDYYVFTAANVNAEKCSFLTNFCSISDKATDAGSQKMDVSLYLSREDGKISKIEISYPNLSMADVNTYYCNYSGKSLSISLERLTYTVKITEWDSDETLSLPSDAVDALSIGGGLQTAVAFSTEPTEYLGINMVDTTFNDASFQVPASWTKYDSTSTAQDYLLNTDGTAYVSLAYIDKSYFRSNSDSKNMEAILESITDGVEVSEPVDVTIDGEDALRFGITASGSSASINGVIYVVPCGDGYMVIEYVMYSGVENIWQSQFNAFIDSIDV